MYILFGILIVIIAVLLALAVIIQNPKGGMMSSTIGSMGNQILGAGRSTDAIEKITWYLAGGLMILCIASIFILPDGKSDGKSDASETSAIQEAIKANKSPNSMAPSAPVAAPQAQPAQTAPASAPATQQSATPASPVATPAPDKK